MNTRRTSLGVLVLLGAGLGILGIRRSYLPESDARSDDAGTTTGRADSVAPEPPASDGAAAAGSTGSPGNVTDACASCASGVCGDGGCDPAVFLTSKEYTGKIGTGGVESADAECAALAARAGLRGTFKAWLGARGGRAPADRFAGKSPRPYRRLDGKRVAGHFAALARNLETPISLTEERVEIPFAYVWTATNGSGKSTANAGDCRGWTSERAADKGASGESDDITDEWTSFGDIACSKTARLYCFEQEG